MRTLIITVGLPGAGKTSWVRQQGIPSVSPDAIRRDAGLALFDWRDEAVVWQRARSMVRALFDQGNETVVVDATHTTRAGRDRWVGPWRRHFVLFPTDAETCLARRIGASEDLVRMVRGMDAKMTLPGYGEQSAGEPPLTITEWGL